MASKWITATVVCVGISIASVNAYAHSGNTFWHALFHHFGGSHGSQTGGGGHSVPELDAATGPMALALLGGVVAIGLERRRRKRQSSHSETE